MIDLKQNVIDTLTMNIYHNLEHITVIHEIEKTTKTYRKLIDVLNEAKLTQNDVMNVMKHLTLNVISQCNTHFLNNQEKINKKQFQHDLK